MTDGPDITGLRRGDAAEETVATLASRAIAVLASKRAQGRPLLSERLVVELVEMARRPEPEALDGAITDILHSGVPGEEIVDFYIPEAARRLGEAWCVDGVGFADVTIASARLQRMLRRLAGEPPARMGEPVHSVLVAVPAGEHHTLGAMVLTEQFRRLGLSVRLLLGESDRRVVATVAEGHFDAIFLSVGGTERLAHARDLVEKSRRAARQGTPIAVGGAAAHTGTDIGKITGADVVATDPKEALRQCGLKISVRGARQRETSG